MKRYLEHMQNRDPHERRTHALRVASAVTGLVFVGWLGTLGMRLAPQEVATDTTSEQTAAVVQTQTRQQGPSLEVSTTSVFLPQYQNGSN